MDTHDRGQNPEEGSVDEILKRLGELLKSLPPDRQEAFTEYLEDRIDEEEDRR